MEHIGIIIGSNRPGRFGAQPAQWLLKLSETYKSAKFEIIDLEEINLPFLDEATPPIMQQYSHEHTKAWSKTVADLDGYLFVTPEYNHSYPAALKNAIDTVYHEWKHKAAAIVSYGAAEGGTRAIEHLRPILGYLGIYDISEFVTIPNYWTQLDKSGQFTPTEDQTKKANALLEELVKWSTIMQQSRKN